ncbi:MAG: hypothetical protein WCK43_00585 [bacterium]
MLKWYFLFLGAASLCFSQEFSRDIISLGTVYSPSQTYKTYDLKVAAPPIHLNDSTLVLPSFKGHEGDITLNRISQSEHFKNLRLNFLTRIKPPGSLTYILNPHIEFKKITQNLKFEKDGFFGSLMFLVNYKPSEATTGWRYGFGLHYSREFDSNTLIPIASAHYLGSGFRSDIGFPSTGFYFFNEKKREWGLRVYFETNLYAYSQHPELLSPETKGLRVWRIDIGPSAQIPLWKSFSLKTSLGYLLLAEAHGIDQNAHKLQLLTKEKNPFFLRLNLSYE